MTVRAKLVSHIFSDLPTIYYIEKPKRAFEGCK